MPNLQSVYLGLYAKTCCVLKLVPEVFRNWNDGSIYHVWLPVSAPNSRCHDKCKDGQTHKWTDGIITAKTSLVYKCCTVKTGWWL